YQQEVMKTLTILQSVMSKAVSEQQSQNDGSLTLTSSQQQAIKDIILKWEQVMSQFVKVATESEKQFSMETSTGHSYHIKSSTSSSTSTSSSNSGPGLDFKPNDESSKMVDDLM
ncbi:hypothetical protein EUTSA_v100054041mg, partial [Eutrema salsugineum]